MSLDNHQAIWHVPLEADKFTPATRAHGRRPSPASDTNESGEAELEAEIVARLEWLDDLIFTAINGDAVALEKAGPAWQHAVDQLGADVLEESRQQYLRRAQSVWHDLRRQPNHPPHKVFAAIEIISMLAGKAW